MKNLILLAFLVVTLLPACDDDDRVEPVEEEPFSGLGIFECSEWETIELNKSFARRVEDTIYQTLHVNYPAVCAAGTRRFDLRAEVEERGSVSVNSELTGLAYKDGVIYAAGNVTMVGRGPEAFIHGDFNQQYTALATFRGEVYGLFGWDGTRPKNTVHKISGSVSPVALYDTSMLGLPEKMYSKDNGGTLWIWTENETIVELNDEEEVENVYDVAELPVNFSNVTDQRRRSLYFDDRAIFLGTSEDSRLTLCQISNGNVSTNTIELDDIAGLQASSAVTFHNDRVYVNLLQDGESNLYVFPIASDGSQNGDVEKFSTKLPGTEVLRDLEIVGDRIFLLFNNSIRYGSSCVL